MAINQKCRRAFELLSDRQIDNRAKATEKSGERGFSLLLRFVQLEAALKVLRYSQFIKDGWPDQLNFLNARWAPLRDLKALDSRKYALLIGSGGNSLKTTRNQIAHEARNLPEGDYQELAAVSDWALAELRRRLPSQQHLSKKAQRVGARRVKG